MSEPILTQILEHCTPIFKSLKNIVKKDNSIGDLVELDNNELKYVSKEPEWEIRLGSINEKGHFQSYISRELWEQIESKLSLGKKWHCETKWIEEEIYYYKVKNFDIRTICKYDLTTNEIKKVHQQKIKINQCDMVTKCIKNPSLMGSKTPAIRICLSEERNLDSNDIPLNVETHRVVIRQRKRYLYYDTYECGWSFELSFYWEGKNRSEAETNQKKVPPLYSVECEMINPRHHVSACSQEYLIASTILKALDFIGPFEDIEWGLI